MTLLTWRWIDALDRRISDLRDGSPPDLNDRPGFIAMLERWRTEDAAHIEAYWGPRPLAHG